MSIEKIMESNLNFFNSILPTEAWICKNEKLTALYRKGDEEALRKGILEDLKQNFSRDDIDFEKTTYQLSVEENPDGTVDLKLKRLRFKKKTPSARRR